MACASKNFIPKYPKVSDVHVTDGYFAPFMEKVRKVSTWDILQKFYDWGALENYARLIRGESGKHDGPPWIHGLICECIRGLSDFLLQEYDAKIDAEIDKIVALIEQAQSVDPDGFINPYTTLKHPEERFGKNGGDCYWLHEMYNTGCLAEAGVHHYRATGKTALLKVAVKAWNYYADFIGDAPKHNVVCEHSLPEKALMRMFDLFEENKGLAEELGARPQEYLRLVRFFIEHKGDHATRYTEPRFLHEYAQDHRPFREQREATGHAVRATLLYEGVAALALQDDDKELKEIITAIHRDIALTKQHINGGVGAVRNEEKFGAQYFLPNDAYLETCAGIGLVFFETEMFKILKDASPWEVVERVLYNLAPASLSHDGVRYTYENPLQSKGDYERWAWHYCPCCPPMFLKFIGMLPTMIFAEDEEGVWLNLFVDSKARLQKGTLSLENNALTIHTDGGEKQWKLRIRVPSWTRNFRILVNGKAQEYAMQGGYAVVDRVFLDGDVVRLDYDVPVVKYEAHPYVRGDNGCVAVMHGPVLYCLESADNPAERFEEFDFTLAKSDALVRQEDGTILATTTEGQKLTFAPYRDWNNRGKGLMRVWVKQEGATYDLLNLGGWEGKLYRPYKEY